MAKFFAKRGFDPARVFDKIRQESQGFLGKALAVIVRGVVAIGPILKPSLHRRAIEQTMFGGVPEDMLCMSSSSMARGLPT